MRRSVLARIQALAAVVAQMREILDVVSSAQRPARGWALTHLKDRSRAEAALCAGFQKREGRAALQRREHRAVAFAIAAGVADREGINVRHAQPPFPRC